MYDLQREIKKQQQQGLELSRSERKREHLDKQDKLKPKNYFQLSLLAERTEISVVIDLLATIHWQSRAEPTESAHWLVGSIKVSIYLHIHFQ